MQFFYPVGGISCCLHRAVAGWCRTRESKPRSGIRGAELQTVGSPATTVLSATTKTKVIFSWIPFFLKIILSVFKKEKKSLSVLWSCSPAKALRRLCWALLHLPSSSEGMLGWMQTESFHLHPYWPGTDWEKAASERHREKLCKVMNRTENKYLNRIQAESTAQSTYNVLFSASKPSLTSTLLEESSLKITK